MAKDDYSVKDSSFLGRHVHSKSKQLLLPNFSLNNFFYKQFLISTFETHKMH